MINLCRCELKLCNYNIICTLGIVETIFITWLQWGYFNAQESEQGCIAVAPFMYFWLMFQIMFLYALISFACCHFARKYCSEDAEDDDSDESEELDGYRNLEAMMMEGVTALAPEGG